MEEQEACSGGAGVDGCPELQLRNVMGQQRKNKEAVSHRSLAEDSGKARPHLRSARRAKGDPAALGETRGAVATVGLRNGGPGAQSGARFGAGEGNRRGPGLGHGKGDAALGGATVCGNGGGTSAESPEAQTCSASQGGRNTQRKKTGIWTDLSLENALNSITNDGMSIREASKLYGIPSSSIRDHLYGIRTSRQKDIRPVLTPHDEKKIVDYIFKMQDRGHPLTAAELCLKVATTTETRSTPWSARGVPGKGWLRRFWSRHPEISSRRSQGLEVARARALCPITAESLYTNLERLYTAHSYPPTHIWNCDESGVQAGRAGGATILARRGNRSVHSIEPDQKEHLSVLSCVNADGGRIPNFYILKGCYFFQDYIANCEEGAVMGMQPNAWMTRWLFES